MVYNKEDDTVPLSSKPGPMTWTMGGREVQAASDDYRTDGDGNWIQSLKYMPSISDNDKKLSCSLGGDSEDNSDVITLKMVMYRKEGESREGSVSS